jgi:hypothetical protein
MKAFSIHRPIDSRTQEEHDRTHERFRVPVVENFVGEYGHGDVVYRCAGESTGCPSHEERCTNSLEVRVREAVRRNGSAGVLNHSDALARPHFQHSENWLS